MSRFLRSLLVPLCGASALVLAGCEGPATGATCPTGSTLTAQNFGNAFMSQYCTRCHSSSLSGSARNGAPSDVNLDTVEGVRRSSGEIDGEAAASATQENTSMPPNGVKPSAEERRKLGEWLACGAP